MTVRSPFTFDASAESVRVRRKTLATDVRVNSAMKVKFLTDTFTPVGTSVDVRVQINASVMGTSMGQVRMLVGAGDQTAAYMRDGATRYWPEAAGIQEFDVGKISYSTSGTLTNTIRVDGLTPGSLYTWSLDVAVVGGNDAVDDLTIANGPHKMAMHPDEGIWAASCFDGARIDVFPSPHSRFAIHLDRAINSDSYYPEQIVTPTQPIGITFTPDGTKLVVCSYGTRVVTIYSTSTWAVLITTAAVGTAGQEPWDVKCIDNTYAWVSKLNGALTRVTLSDGTLTHYALGGTSLRGIAADAAGQLLYVCEYGADRIYRFSTASNTVTGSVNLTAGNNPLGIALTPAKDYMYVACDTASVLVRRMDTATMGVTSSTALPASPTPPISAAAQYIAISPDGHMGVVGFVNGFVGFFGVSNDTEQSEWFDQLDIGGQIADVYVDSMGNVFVLLYADDKVQIWPGADVQIRALTGGDFYQENAIVDVVGAT